MQEQREHLFICYCEEDKRWLTKFQRALAPLQRKEQFTIWDYTKITASTKWTEEIEKAVASSSVALLLVSIDFLASEFIFDYELPLIQIAEEKGLRIAWVAVSHSLYQYTDLAKYQALNDPAQPLDSLTPAKLNCVMVRICKKIYNLMQQAYILQSTEQNI